MKRWHLYAGALAAALVFLGVRTLAQKSAPLPTLTGSARYEHVSRTAADWIREGYIEMVSPIRPPTSEDSSIRIVVYVKWPDGARVHLVPHGDDVSLEMPEGTQADRVEMQGDGSIDAEPTAAWHVLDVRGITFTREMQRFRVFRPVRDGTNELLGIDWPRGFRTDAEASNALSELVLRGAVAGPTDARERAHAADRLRALNACASCHVPFASPRSKVTDPGFVNRGTDASGLYQIAAVLHDRLPFETYRPRDANRGDPFVRRECGATETASGRCADGSIALGELDVKRGLSAHDPHVLRVCAARLALASRLDGTAPTIAASIDECRSKSD